MIDTMQLKAKDHFLAQFDRLEAQLAGRGLPWLRTLRKDAFARFEELGWPGPRHEDWRFTNVAPLAERAFETLADADTARVTTGKLEQAGVSYAPGFGTRLVCVNGHFAERFSASAGAPKDTFTTALSNALAARANNPLAPLVEPHLARHARFEDHPFVALNTAFFQDGGFLLIPPGTVLERPVYLIFATGPRQKPLATHPRNLVVVGKGSQVTLVEMYLGLGDNICFTNAVTEIVAGEGAVIDHYKLQQESPQAFHVAVTQVHQDRASVFRSHYIGLGGALVRNEVRATLDAEGCECTLNGLYLAGGTQHMDNHTVIDHARPHCASHELYKGILDGKARGVFNGKIFVRQDAQKTDAKQTNQTLLLSEDAVINTKPQLEIFADDVKCTHGATVGQLSADALFYLRSRGLGLSEARSLLTYAFANDIIERIQVEPLRRRLEEHLLAQQHLPPAMEGEEEP
jgi:Fe-S cluster assembly protein SufD